MVTKNFNWDATTYFEHLTQINKFAQSKHFRFCRVSGLQGFEEVLAGMKSTTAFVAVSDLSQGYTDLAPSPKTRRTKTVFLGMRHKIDDMAARNIAMDNLRELFRQFMSKLILEKTALEENLIYLDGKIRFTEIDSYFASGCACAYFNVVTDTFTDLRFNFDEWLPAT